MGLPCWIDIQDMEGAPGRYSCSIWIREEVREDSSTVVADLEFSGVMERNGDNPPNAAGVRRLIGVYDGYEVHLHDGSVLTPENNMWSGDE